MAPSPELVRTRLAAWYTASGRDLPWRSADSSPWGILVSEVMSQQTPIARVEPAWRAWMQMWPTPAALAHAPTAAVLRAWGSLGYPRRALRLQECARIIEEQHGGEVPQTEEALLTLPGIGSYTAASVVAFAFHRRSIVIDTNVRRVLARVFRGMALAEPNVTAAQTRHAAAIVPDDDADAALWAVSSMEFGALVCSARKPKCDACPIADLCAWRASGFPADEHAARRRAQAWVGTDRQVRGQIMAALRAASEPILPDGLDLVRTGTTPAESGQVERCIAGLIDDRLIEATTDGALRLPTHAAPASRR